MPGPMPKHGQASRFQIPFEILTTCNPTSFWPFEIQTCADFRSQCIFEHWAPKIPCAINSVYFCIWLFNRKVSKPEQNLKNWPIIRHFRSGFQMAIWKPNTYNPNLFPALECSNHLNTGLVQNCNGRFWSGCQMVDWKRPVYGPKRPDFENTGFWSKLNLLHPY